MSISGISRRDTTGCLSRAIATYAEAVYGELEPDERQALPVLFRKLVRAGSKSEEDTRRRVPLGELCQPTQRVARKLAGKRLLITTRSEVREPSADAEKQAATVDQHSDSVEVAHEELLRRWGRLQQWVNADREFLLWRSRLDLKVEERHREGDSALWQGKPLRDAAGFYPARKLDLTVESQAFLDASVDAERDRQKAERQRKMRIVGANCLVTLAAIFFGWGFMQHSKRARANTDLQRFLGDYAEPEQIASNFDKYVKPHKELVIQALHDAFDERERAPEQRLNAAYALARFDEIDDDELRFALSGVLILPSESSENVTVGMSCIRDNQRVKKPLRDLFESAKSDSTATTRHGEPSEKHSSST